MYKLFLLGLISAAVVGCAHPDDRQPSSDLSSQPQFFGKVKFSDGKHTAGEETAIGEIDSYYTVQVDCPGANGRPDGLLSREEQGRIIRIDADTVSREQKTAYATFKRRSEIKERKASASPYLSVSLESVSGDPCSKRVSPIGRVLVGTNPTFFSPRR